MSNAIKTIVRDYGWVHLGIGLVGNVLFLCGSILFLPAFQSLRPIPIYVFISGSGLMLVGALGRLLVEIWRRERE
jgi:hypothetical protein